MPGHWMIEKKRNKSPAFTSQSCLSHQFSGNTLSQCETLPEDFWAPPAPSPVRLSPPPQANLDLLTLRAFTLCVLSSQHILIVQRQLSVLEEELEEFRLALRQYMECACAQTGCLQSVYVLFVPFMWFLFFLVFAKGFVKRGVRIKDAHKRKSKDQSRKCNI